MTECPPHVLEGVINFMYGIELPVPEDMADVESVLVMADLYLMEDLKDSVASLLAPHLNKDNVMDMYLLADRLNAQKLKKMCAYFTSTSITIATRCLGLDTEDILKNTFMENVNIENDMIVRCKTASLWWYCVDTKLFSSAPATSYNYMQTPSNTYKVSVMTGTIGRVVATRNLNDIDVKWEIKQDIRRCENSSLNVPSFGIPIAPILPMGSKSDLEIITPPIKRSMFNN